MLRRSIPFAALVLAVSGLALAQPAQTPKPANPAPKADKPAGDKGEKPKDGDKKDKKDAKTATLKVGDKAPALTIDKFLKGSEVKSFEKGKVYVVEFWATWCGPCIKNIPHLTDIQKQYKDQGVTVIGVTASEMKGKDGTDNREKTASDFVAKQGEKMGYTVAYDGNGDMRDNWLAAAGQSGIPCAFVVDATGTVRFIGHPAKPEFEDAIKAAAAAAKGGHAEARPQGPRSIFVMR